jgi:chemotaxis protein MotB
MDQQVEEARLAAAKREAMEALLSDLQTKNADLETALSEEELTRLAESEAAAALRARLENADAELTAMTLALEAERKNAEETLTLLAAARQAEADLNAQLVAALLQGEDLTRNLQTTQNDLATTQAELADTKADLQSAQDDVEAARAARRAVEAELASLQDGASDRAALVGRVADLETRLAQILQERGDLETSAEEVRAQLVAALAAKKAAEAEAAEKRSAAEQRDILLAVAQDKVAESEERASAAAKQAELLNQQVAQLRSQLGELQSILDDSKARDVAAQIQIEQLGSELNAAIARVAQEERRRRQLEEERARQLEEENKSLANYRSEFFGRLREVIGDRDGVRIEGDRFVFSSEVLFGVGSADLSPQGQREISKVAAILRDIAADVPSGIDWIIRVDGHTDDVPIRFGREFQDNWELSQARALSVVRDMIQFHGIPPRTSCCEWFRGIPTGQSRKDC